MTLSRRRLLHTATAALTLAATPGLAAGALTAPGPSISASSA